MKRSDQDKDIASGHFQTPAEVATAVGSLSLSDKTRLVAVARLFASRTDDEAQDLIQEALARVLKGRARWPRSASIVALLAATMRSIAMQRRRRSRSSSILHHDVPNDRDAAAELEVNADLERIQLVDHFSDDQVAQQIVAGMLAGLTQDDLRKMTGLSATQFQGKVIKIRRRLATLHVRPVPEAPSVRLAPEALDALKNHGYSEHEVFTFVVPKRTLMRRRSGAEPLTIEETDKALRLERIASQATRAFGDSEKAHRWLRKPKRELAGETPLAYLASEAGARVVEEMLFRVEHGIFA